MYDVKPTPMQAKALELIRDGTPPVRAMREAGYSEETSHAPSKNLLRGAGARSYIEQYRDAFARTGITQDYMAKKTRELLEAEMVKSSMTGPDIRVPDNKTRIEALKIAREDMGLTQQTQPFIQLNTKEMTVEFSSNDSKTT